MKHIIKFTKWISESTDEKQAGMGRYNFLKDQLDRETEKFTKIPILYAKTEAKKLLELHKFNLDYK